MPEIAPGTAPLPIAGEPVERSDAAANRRRILQAARAVLADHGAAGLSMNAVANVACVGKGTIFRRFGDREGLLTAMLDTDMAALQDAFLSGPPPLGPGAPAAERLEAFLRAYDAFESDHLELLLAAERAGPVRPPATATVMLHLRTLLAALDPRIDAPVAAALLFGAVGPDTLHHLHVTEGADAARVADGAIALLRGLRG